MSLCTCYEYLGDSEYGSIFGEYKGNINVWDGKKWHYGYATISITDACNKSLYIKCQSSIKSFEETLHYHVNKLAEGVDCIFNKEQEQDEIRIVGISGSVSNNSRPSGRRFIYSRLTNGVYIDITADKLFYKQTHKQ